MAIKRIGKGFELDKVKRNYTKFQQDAPKVIANSSKNWFLDGFKKGGGQTDASKSGWKARLPTAKNDSGRGILIQTGALRRSIGILKASLKEIIIASTGIPYAKRHNEGLNMPMREYIGDSEEMNEKNIKIIVRLLEKVFRR